MGQIGREGKLAPMQFKCPGLDCDFATNMEGVALSFAQHMNLESSGQGRIGFGLLGAMTRDSGNVIAELEVRCPKCKLALVGIKKSKAGNAAASMEGEIAHRLDNKTIFVNGVKTKVSWNRILYSGAVGIAFPSAPDGALFTVTWSSKGRKTGGVLTRDNYVDIEDGMRFDVTETGN